MQIIDTAYRFLLLLSAIALSVTICISLFRAILGPRFSDRIMAVNIICTKIIIIISFLSFLLDDSGFLDIALIYAMINFLSIVVLSKCYLLPHHKNPTDPDHAIHGSGEGASRLPEASVRLANGTRRSSEIKEEVVK